MRKIVFVNRFFYPDHSATSQLLSDIAFDLAGRGWEVEVITSRQLYEDAAAELPTTEQIRGVLTWRVSSSAYGRGNLLGRALDYLSFYWGAIRVMLKDVDEGDIVVVKTDPPLISLFAAFVTKRRRAILVNWVQDIFPEVASALGVKGFYPAANRLLIWLRNKSWRMARANVVLGNRMKSVLVNEGISDRSIHIIHNWADGREIKPVSAGDNKLRREWGVADKFVIGYSGNMGRAHEFSTILSIAAALKTNPKVVFLFVGGGAQREKIQEGAVALGIDNIIFKGYQSREELSFSLSVPDLHLISLKPELEGLIVPSKFYGIAAVARPVLYIGDKQGEIPEILKAEQIGVAIDVGGVEEGVRFIQRLIDDETYRGQLGAKMRRVFDRRFEKEHALESWRTLFENMDG